MAKAKSQITALLKRWVGTAVSASNQVRLMSPRSTRCKKILVACDTIRAMTKINPAIKMPGTAAAMASANCSNTPKSQTVDLSPQGRVMANCCNT